MRLVGLTVFLVGFFWAFADSASACTCYPPSTVDNEFAQSENVVTAILGDFEEIDRRVEGTNVYRTYAAIMTIEMVYKGNLSVAQTIKVYNGGGGDCTTGFERRKIGKKFLFFMGAARKEGNKPEMYFVSLCSRSKEFDRAAADLKYLDNRTVLEGKTRLSGIVRASGENISLPSVANLEVTVSGSKFQRDLQTNQDGFFELWDVPPGDYTLTFQVPGGWKMAGYSVARSADSGWQRQPHGNTIKVTLAARKHYEVRVFLRINNEISGTVLSPAGTPMKGVCVGAYWLTPTSSMFMIPSNCSNEKGEFAISELPPGKYRLEINGRGTLSSANPFETFYYPGVQKKEDAEPLVVKEGVSVRNLIVRVAKTLPLIKISGQLTLRDGQPFPAEEIRFTPRDDTKYERVEVDTDKNGNFEFEIPVGATGELTADTDIYVIEFKKCPTILEMRKTRTGRAAAVRSNVVRIEGQTSLENIKLVYPLTCGAKLN